MVPTQMDYVHIISNASMMVKFVLLLLLFFSVMSWSIIIIKIRYIRKAFKESDISISGKAGILPGPSPRPSSSVAARSPVSSESATANCASSIPAVNPAKSRLPMRAPPRCGRVFRAATM